MERAFETGSRKRRPNEIDAGILLEIAQWYVRSGMPGALGWLWEQEGDGTALVSEATDTTTAAQICVYYDAVGALYKHGLIDDALLFDWLTIAGVWDRIKGYVQADRRRQGDPHLWSCFEELARAHKRAIGEYST
ncbi:MAG TPA: hypothetical protein VFA78_00020 [Chloroflexota bacterium]|nr:hypothetical protein [Chloroflexota bacterium]